MISYPTIFLKQCWTRSAMLTLANFLILILNLKTLICYFRIIQYTFENSDFWSVSLRLQNNEMPILSVVSDSADWFTYKNKWRIWKKKFVIFFQVLQHEKLWDVVQILKPDWWSGGNNTTENIYLLHKTLKQFLVFLWFFMSLLSLFFVSFNFGNVVYILHISMR